MNTIACFSLSWKPSVGSAAHTVVLTVTLPGVVQVGGVPVAAKPNANTLRRLARSQPAFTPFAMHAAGAPVLESRPNVGWTFISPLQSKASLQTFNAAPPLPSVTRPPKLGSKFTSVLGLTMLVV